MDINFLRLILILLGIIVIAFIVWDGYRKKRIADEKAAEFTHEALNELMDARDISGFDINGVGESRVVSESNSDNFDEPLVDGPLVAEREDHSYQGDETLNIDDELESSTEEDKQEKAAPQTKEPDLIITLSILAKAEEGFVGEKLLHCMLSRGLRYGDMSIFHRHRNTSGEGQVQFSLANAFKPGTFNLDDMSSFQTKGVTLFMMLPGPENPSKSYQLMLETAQYLAGELGGQLVDGTRSVLTQQTIQHFSEQIKEFERKNINKQHTN